MPVPARSCQRQPWRALPCRRQRRQRRRPFCSCGPGSTPPRFSGQNQSRAAERAGNTQAEVDWRTGGVVSRGGATAATRSLSGEVTMPSRS